MKHSASAWHRRLQADEGFTLIEVIVALVLLGIVATGALYFFIQGTRTTSYLQRSQDAVSVANEAMERAHAINPLDSLTARVTGLVVGRAQADVQAAWTSAATLGIEGVSETYPLWDPGPGVTDSASAALPLTYQSSHSSQTYDVTLLVGSCFRSRSTVSPDQVCGKLTGLASDPGVTGTPAGMVRLLRIIAFVTWSGASQQCSSNVCSYQLSGLLDQSGDLTWNQVITPIAVNDFEEFDFGERRAINVLTNDLIGPVTSNPVTILTLPSQGTATVNANGVVTYTASPNASGKFPFTYRIKAANGAQSDPATVEITVRPTSSSDTYAVLTGSTTDLPVTSNDKGSPASLTITAPDKGTAVISGLNVRYTAGGTAGTTSFLYTFTDGSGQTTEPPVLVTINVSNPPPPVAQDQTVVIPARLGAADVFTGFTAQLLSGNTDTTGLGVTVVGVKPSAGTLRVGGTPYAGTSAGSTSARGTTIDFSPAQNTIGEYSFTYYISRTTGSPSVTKTVTLRVMPNAVADTFGVYAHASDVYLPVGRNDTPTVFTASTGATLEFGPMSDGCGVVSATQGHLAIGEVRLTLADNTKKKAIDCSFTYSVVGVGLTSASLRSGPVTVSFQLSGTK